MRRLLLVLALSFAAAFVSSPALALSPDDAIYLTQQGVEDEIIIAKLCMDNVPWDLTAEEILQLREEGVSREVVQALIDPTSASERYGFTLGDAKAEPESDPGNYAEGTTRTSLVFSFGYYYGPLGVHYLYDPYFYPYYCSTGWGFNLSYWPSYYRATYFPYHYGYYAYPYYYYSTGSYYSGYPYYGPAYPYYCAAPLPAPYVPYVKSPVRYRDPVYSNPPPAYGGNKPNTPEERLDNGKRQVLGQYARDTRRGLGSVDGRQGGERAIGRAGQKVGRGTAADRHLASRDITGMGRGSRRGTIRGDQTAERIGSRRSDQPRVIRGGRSSIGTPRATPGQTPRVIRGSGNAAPAPKGEAVKAPSTSAPRANVSKGERKAEARSAPEERSEGRGSKGGKRNK